MISHRSIIGIQDLKILPLIQEEILLEDFPLNSKAKVVQVVKVVKVLQVEKIEIIIKFLSDSLIILNLKFPKSTKLRRSNKEDG